MDKRTCSIEACEKPSKTRGWCGMHYKRWKKHGDPLREPWRGCSVDGCDERHQSHRYCRSHLLLEKTLCILPALERFLAVGPASLTLDLRLLDAAAAVAVVRHFQAGLADPGAAPAAAAALSGEQPAESTTYGAYLTGITGDEAISRLDLLREELHADSC